MKKVNTSDLLLVMIPCPLFAYFYCADYSRPPENPGMRMRYMLTKKVAVPFPRNFPVQMWLSLFLSFPVQIWLSLFLMGHSLFYTLRSSREYTVLMSQYGAY